MPAKATVIEMVEFPRDSGRLSREELMVRVYDELRRLAAGYLGRERLTTHFSRQL